MMTKKLTILVMIVLSSFIIKSCIFENNNDITNILTSQEWVIQNIRLSDVPNSPIENESFQLFQINESAVKYSFKDDGTFECSSISKNEIIKNGKWSSNAITNQLFFDSDTFSLITNKIDLLELEMTQYKSDSLLSINHQQHIGNRIILVFVPFELQINDDNDSRFRISKIEEHWGGGEIITYEYYYSNNKLTQIKSSSNDNNKPNLDNKYEYIGDTVINKFDVPTWKNVNGKMIIIPVEYFDTYIFKNGKLITYINRNFLRSEYKYQINLLTEHNRFNAEGEWQSTTKWVYGNDNKITKKEYNSNSGNTTISTFTYETNLVTEYLYYNGTNTNKTYWIFENGKRIKYYDSALINGQWVDSPHEKNYEYNTEGILSKSTMSKSDYSLYFYEQANGNFRSFEMPEQNFFWKLN